MKLRNGLCPKCSAAEQREIKVEEIPTIELCKICGSYGARGRWSSPSSKGLEKDLSALLKAILAKLIRMDEGNIRELSIPKMPQLAGSGSTHFQVLFKIQDNGQISSRAIRESSMTAKLTMTTCPSCSLIKRKYYEATLQIRTLGAKMSANEKEKMLDQINRLVERIAKKNRQAFISKYEDKPGGFDLFLGSSQLAYLIASKFRANKGILVKESFKAGKVDKSSGNRKNKVTILIKLPQTEAWELT